VARPSSSLEGRVKEEQQHMIDLSIYTHERVDLPMTTILIREERRRRRRRRRRRKQSWSYRGTERQSGFTKFNMGGWIRIKKKKIKKK
jgi:hypothetical protein